MTIKKDEHAGLENEIQGTWWLVSREDFTQEGIKRIDPVLGADPIAILVYAKGHFAAQFMKKDRSNDLIAQPVAAGKNNTAAVGGYDAYFGNYRVDPNSGQVEHTLVGSINPANIGLTVHRDLTVANNILTIRLATTTAENEAIMRTLTWKRIA